MTNVTFQVGKTYSYLGEPTIKVLSRTEKTITVFNYRAFEKQRKRVQVYNDYEYIVLPDTGDTVTAFRVCENEC